MLPVGAPNGWGGVNPGYKLDPVSGEMIPAAPPGSNGNVDDHGNPVPLVFDLNQFVQRADVRALPPNYQETLVFFNQSYQSLKTIEAAQMGVLDGAIAEAQAELADMEAMIRTLEAMIP